MKMRVSSAMIPLSKLITSTTPTPSKSSGSAATATETSSEESAKSDLALTFGTTARWSTSDMPDGPILQRAIASKSGSMWTEQYRLYKEMDTMLTNMAYYATLV